jgi:hypothetical protein
MSTSQAPQRKTVTVVFADVAGSTALGEQVDPEALQRVLSDYFGEAETALRGHGGTVEKFYAGVDDKGYVCTVAAELAHALSRLEHSTRRCGWQT